MLFMKDHVKTWELIFFLIISESAYFFDALGLRTSKGTH